jgi:hypothetical protein
MTGQPRVYGTVDQFALLLDGIAKLVDREPDATFVDDEVRVAARHLGRLLEIRLREADAGRDAVESP